DNQITISVRLIDLPVRQKNERAVRTVELASASVNCPSFDRAGEIVHGQSARSEASGIGFNSNRALNAVDIHLRYTRQDRDALRHGGGRILVEIAIGQRIGKQTDQINRLIVRICFCERRRAGQIERQLSGSALDRSLHVCGSVNDTFAENELERERRVPLRACARDDVEPWNLQELFLE